MNFSGIRYGGIGKRKRTGGGEPVNMGTPGGSSQGPLASSMKAFSSGMAYDPAGVTSAGSYSAPRSGGDFLPRSQFMHPMASAMEQLSPMASSRSSSKDIFDKYVMKALAKDYVRSRSAGISTGPSSAPGMAASTSTSTPAQPTAAPAGPGQGPWSGGGPPPGGIAGPGSGEGGLENPREEKRRKIAEEDHSADTSSDEGESSGEGKKDVDTDRTEPITPATGATQTPATANSLVGANPILEDAQKHSPEEVIGEGEERANVGKGGETGYEFAGPYDYPARPSGRLDSTLTALGAWRSKTGEHSASLWQSSFTEKGKPSKKPSYWKWSSKNGGNWSSLGKFAATRALDKLTAYKQGARFMSLPVEGTPLKGLLSSSLRQKAISQAMAIAGAENTQERRESGYQK